MDQRQITDKLCDDCIFYRAHESRRLIKKENRDETIYREYCDSPDTDIKWGTIPDTSIAMVCPAFSPASIRSTLKLPNPTQRKLKRRSKFKVVKPIIGVNVFVGLGKEFTVAGYSNLRGEAKYKITQDAGGGLVSEGFYLVKDVDALYDAGFFEKVK